MTYIASLRAENFRNLCSLKLAFDGRIAVFTGANGAGKTNFLEAISLLAPGRGLHRAFMARIACDSGQYPNWGLGADLRLEQGTIPIRIGTRVENPEKRIFQIAEKNVSGLMIGKILRVNWLIPAMNQIFTGSASLRRRFLDRLVATLNPAHSVHIARYEKTMRNRNHLLQQESYDPNWLGVLERQMAKEGATITWLRRDFLDKIETILWEMIQQAKEDKHESWLYERVKLHLAEGVEINPDSVSCHESKELWAQNLAVLFQQMRPRDQIAKRALCGPHRADWIIKSWQTGRLANEYSTGQQKALLIAIILAHARMVAREKIDCIRILLLDDICAYLDEERRKALFVHLENLAGHIFLTATEREIFQNLASKAQFFTVEKGMITPQS